MAGFVVVGLSLAFLVFSITLLAPLVPTPQVALFNFTFDTSLLTLYFFIFCTLYNSILITVIGIYDRTRAKAEKQSALHSFSIMIPARNEEEMISNTLNSILEMDYPSEKFDIIIIDDGSSDRTPQILKRYRRKFSNVSILRVPFAESGSGKSSALNRGYKYLLEHHPNVDKENWIIGVFDADGMPESSMLRKVSYQFTQKKVGAVQTLVRISNRNDSLLAKLQDIEFVTFAKVTQFVRNIFHGAVALGGNGQFVRAIALESIEIVPGQFWRKNALTEDLDLGTRLLLAGWENTFLATSAVQQQGVTDLGALYKQRTRWCWGTLQTFITYLLSLKVFKHKIGLVKKIDLAYYLSCQIIPPMVLATWLLSLLSMLGIIFVYNPFPAYFMIANSVSFLPLIGYGLWTTRREYPLKKLIPFLLITNAYTYHWIICTMRALLHVLKRDKPLWIKTAKILAVKTG
ncbi:MAG: glycosyltransferase [Candidatus Hodarchaeota archaeon]